jgi:hypothetical protein
MNRKFNGVRNMAWQQTYAPDLHVLLINVDGTLEKPLWQRQTLAALQEGVINHACYRALVDYRQARLRISGIDLYERPLFYEHIGIPYCARIALMYPPGQQDIATIQEVTADRGYNVKVFQDEKEAMVWLTQR